MTYEASIEYIATKDDYNEGEQGESVASWDETITADTVDALRDKLVEATNSPFKEWSDDQINEYGDAFEYYTSYLAITDDYTGMAPASTFEIDEWKEGRETLYSINCHIMVSSITKAPAQL